MNGKLVTIDIAQQLKNVTAEGFTPDTKVLKGMHSNDPCHCGSEVPYRLCHHPHAQEKLEKTMEHMKQTENNSNSKKKTGFFGKIWAFITKPFKAIWNGIKWVGRGIKKVAVWIKNASIKIWNKIKLASIWLKNKTVAAYGWTKTKTIKVYNSSKEWAKARKQNVVNFFEARKAKAAEMAAQAQQQAQQNAQQA